MKYKGKITDDLDLVHGKWSKQNLVQKCSTVPTTDTVALDQPFMWTGATTDYEGTTGFFTYGAIYKMTNGTPAIVKVSEGGANDGVLTIKQEGETKATFSANSAADVEVDIKHKTGNGYFHLPEDGTDDQILMGTGVADGRGQWVTPVSTIIDSQGMRVLSDTPPSSTAVVHALSNFDNVTLAEKYVKQAKLKTLKTGVDETENSLIGDGSITMPHLYQHMIPFLTASGSVYGHVSIFNNSETPFTYATLKTWLTNNGFTSNSNFYPNVVGTSSIGSYYVATSSGGSTTQQVTVLRTVMCGAYVEGNTLYSKNNISSAVSWVESEIGTDKVLKIY